jgi:hypothetical protein
MHEQAPVRGELRMEGHPQQAALPAGLDLSGEIHEIGRLHASVPVDDPDPAALLVDEQSASPVAGIRDADRAAEAGGDLLE